MRPNQIDKHASEFVEWVISECEIMNGIFGHPVYISREQLKQLKSLKNKWEAHDLAEKLKFDSDIFSEGGTCFSPDIPIKSSFAWKPEDDQG